MTALHVRKADITSPEVAALIGALNAELEGRYPEEGANHFRLDAEEVAPGRGAFLIAWHGDDAVGCGAIRKLDDQRAEIKRMYVRPDARGHGIAGVIVAALEVEARSLGVHTLVLETGIRQPEAIAVYRRAGFVDIPSYGEYVDSPFSVCMSRTLP